MFLSLISKTTFAICLSGFFLCSVLLAAPAADNADEWKVPSFKARKKNPIPSNAETIALGKILFTRECMPCHGKTGRGDGPSAKDLEKSPGNLTAPQMWEHTDGAIFFKITVGRRPMPAFRDMFTADERWHVVNYVRTLAPRKGIRQIEPEWELPESARKEISAILLVYLNIHSALVSEKIEVTHKATQDMLQAIGRMESFKVEDIPEPARVSWTELAASLRSDVNLLQKSEDLAKARIAFRTLSLRLETILSKFGHAEKYPILRWDCAKAFDEGGAAWLQRDKTASNPYLGQAELRCGQNTVSLHPIRKQSSAERVPATERM